MMQHPVLSKIDRERPYFDRLIIRQSGDQEEEWRLQLWLPVQLDNGGWVAAVHLAGPESTAKIAAMPGSDPLDALIRSLSFFRGVMEQAGGRFLFGHREMAGLPVSLNCGFYPAVLLDIEMRASDLANAAAVERGLLPFPIPREGAA